MATQCVLFFRYFIFAYCIFCQSFSLPIQNVGLNAAFNNMTKEALKNKCPFPDASTFQPEIQAEPELGLAAALGIESNNPATSSIESKRSKAFVYQACSGLNPVHADPVFQGLLCNLVFRVSGVFCKMNLEGKQRLSNSHLNEEYVFNKTWDVCKAAGSFAADENLRHVFQFITNNSGKNCQDYCKQESPISYVCRVLVGAVTKYKEIQATATRQGSPGGHVVNPGDARPGQDGTGGSHNPAGGPVDASKPMETANQAAAVSEARPADKENPQTKPSGFGGGPPAENPIIAGEEKSKTGSSGFGGGPLAGNPITTGIEKSKITLSGFGAGSPAGNPITAVEEKAKTGSSGGEPAARTPINGNVGVGAGFPVPGIGDQQSDPVSGYAKDQNVAQVPAGSRVGAPAGAEGKAANPMADTKLDSKEEVTAGALLQKADSTAGPAAALPLPTTTGLGQPGHENKGIQTGVVNDRPQNSDGNDGAQKDHGNNELLNGDGNKGPQNVNENKGIPAGDGNTGLTEADRNNGLQKGDGNNGVQNTDENNIIQKGGGNNGLLKGDGNNVLQKGDENNVLQKGDENNGLQKGDGNNGVQNGDGKNGVQNGDISKTPPNGDGNNGAQKGPINFWNKGFPDGHDLVANGGPADLLPGNGGGETGFGMQTNYQPGSVAGEEGPPSGHFMAYFLTALVLCVAGYVVYHNKQKILAFVLEGRRDVQRRRAPAAGSQASSSSTAKYSKLQPSVEEVLPSLEKSTTAKNYIY